MPISFAQLCFADPSPEARRLLWHVLSIGAVSRDETEHHEGMDKAGLFLFQVTSGTGYLETSGNRYPLARGNLCWLLDMREPRRYRPSGGKALRTRGVRFSGPGVEAWLELLGHDLVFALPAGALGLRLARLRHLVEKRLPQHEWAIHSELTALWGKLLATRRAFGVPAKPVPLPVARVLETVFGDPSRDWQARELAEVAAVSYSRLRDQFQQTQGETLHTFLQRTRIDVARRLLGDRRLTIKEVSLRLNFSSEFYFSRVFRRVAGMSPTEFRKLGRA